MSESDPVGESMSCRSVRRNASSVCGCVFTVSLALGSILVVLSFNLQENLRSGSEDRGSHSLKFRRCVYDLCFGCKASHEVAFKANASKAASGAWANKDFTVVVSDVTFAYISCETLLPSLRRSGNN